jgi:hypothetical protein
MRELILIEEGEVRAHQAMERRPQRCREDYFVDVPPTALVLHAHRIPHNYPLVRAAQVDTAVLSLDKGKSIHTYYS